MFQKMVRVPRSHIISILYTGINYAISIYKINFHGKIPFLIYNDPLSVLNHTP